MENTALEHKTSGLSLQEYHDKYFDGNVIWQTYIGKGSGFRDDTIHGLFPALIKMFSSGDVKGNTLIQLSLPPHIHYSFTACAHFTEIIVGAATDSCLRVIEKWRKNEADALDMCHVAQFVCDCEGNREKGIEKEQLMRSKMRPVLKYDVSKSNPFCPVVLPYADCLLLTQCLELHATDKASFCTYLGNVSTLLKPGGHLIMVVLTDATFYMVGDFKFPHLCFDEGFLRKALIDKGYLIKDLQVFPRIVAHMYDIVDYTAFIVVNARKETQC